MAEAAAATTGTEDKGTAAAAPATGATTTTDKGAAGTGAAAAVTTADKGTAAAAAGGEKKGYWPEDWQSRVSKGDDKRQKALKKFDSPDALAESYLNLERRFSSGEYVAVLPKDPSEDDLKAWRKAHGIPDKADGYDLKDLKIPDEDKEIVNGIVSRLHAKNASPDVVREAVSAYYAEQDRQAQALTERDEGDRQATLDALSEEWGNQRTRNINLVRGVLTNFPESVRELVGQARLPNGKLMFNDPDVARGFATIALALNPAGVVVAPGGTGDIGKTALNEYQDLQKFMREHRDQYNKDQAKQDRMGQLIEYLSANELIDASGNVVSQSKGKKAA